MPIFQSVSVVLCYWLLCAKAPNYMQAATNTHVMGALIERLIKAINHYHKINYDRISIFGFGLDTHVAAFTGRRLNDAKIRAI